MRSPETAPWDGLALTLPGWAGPAALLAALVAALALLAWLWAGWSRATPVPPLPARERTLSITNAYDELPRLDRNDTCPSCGVPLMDHPSIREWVANGRYSDYRVYLDACDEPSRLDRLDRTHRSGPSTGPGFVTWDDLAQPVDPEALTAEQLDAAAREARGRRGR